MPVSGVGASAKPQQSSSVQYPKNAAAWSQWHLKSAAEIHAAIDKSTANLMKNPKITDSTISKADLAKIDAKIAFIDGAIKAKKGPAADLGKYKAYFVEYRNRITAMPKTTKMPATPREWGNWLNSRDDIFSTTARNRVGSGTKKNPHMERTLLLKNVANTVAYLRQGVAAGKLSKSDYTVIMGRRGYELTYAQWRAFNPDVPSTNPNVSLYAAYMIPAPRG